MTAGPAPPSPTAPDPGAADRTARPARAGRERTAVLLVCAAGGGAALLAAGRVWLRLAAPRTAPLPPLSVVLTGRDVEPLVPALGVVGLAGLVALLATRGWGRLVVGVLLAAAGLALVLRSLPHLAAPAAGPARTLLLDQGRVTGQPAGATVTASASPVWPLVAAVGGAALLAGGLGTVLRSRRWPGMSTRYDARPPASAPAATVPRPRGAEARGVEARSAEARRAEAGAPPGEPGEPGAGSGEAWEALDRGEDPTLD